MFECVDPPIRPLSESEKINNPRYLLRLLDCYIEESEILVRKFRNKGYSIKPKSARQFARLDNFFKRHIPFVLGRLRKMGVSLSLDTYDRLDGIGFFLRNC